MNAVQKVLAELSDDDLRRGVAELHRLEHEAVLPDGVVRETAAKLMQRVGLPEKDARNIAESHVLRAAAFKWAGLAP